MKKFILLLFIQFVFWGSLSAQGQYFYEVIPKVEMAIKAKLAYDFIQNETDSTGHLIKKINRFDQAVLEPGCRLKLEVSEVTELTFPNEEYLLLEVFHNPGIIKCGEHNKNIISVHGDLINEKHHILIAYHKENKNILYISGGVAHNRVSRYFKINTEKDLAHFLVLKLYSYKLTDLRFVDSTSKPNQVFYLEAFSRILNRKIRITVSEKDWDVIAIERL